MPVDRLQFAQLFILLMALPAQYLLTEWYGSKSDSMRARSIQEIIRNIKESAESCKAWLKAAGTYMITGSFLRLDLKKLKKKQQPKTKLEGESIAHEVFQYSDPTGNGYFSTSTTVRSPKPKAVKYRVGQVIKHRKFGYRGVIIGWDDTCRAPSSWILTMHGNNPDIEKTPHYSILVDKRDRREIQTTYVAQENIDIVTNTEVQHPSLWDYFDFYDGAQYHMRPAMHELHLFLCALDETGFGNIEPPIAKMPSLSIFGQEKNVEYASVYYSLNLYFVGYKDSTDFVLWIVAFYQPKYEMSTKFRTKGLVHEGVNEAVSFL